MQEDQVYPESDVSIEERILENLSIAVGLRKADQDNSGSYISTRIGGLPDFGEGMEWPRSKITNLPLHFIAQIDFEELHPLPSPIGELLPSAGIASFFGDIYDGGDWEYNEPDVDTRVLFTRSNKSNRSRVPLPRDIPPMGHCHRGRLELARKQYFWEPMELKPAVIETYRGLPSGKPHPGWYVDQARAYERMVASIDRVTDGVRDREDKYSPEYFRHQVL